MMSSDCHDKCVGSPLSSLSFLPFVFSSSPYFLPSVQVKLRRRTKGEVWEVVSVQDTDETLSVLTSLKQVSKNDDEFLKTHLSSGSALDLIGCFDV